MATSKSLCFLILSWLTANVCYSQELISNVPPEVLSIVYNHTSDNPEIYLSANGDLNGDGIEDWAIAAIPSGAKDEREEIQFFILIGQKGSSYKLLYHFAGIPVLMRGAHISDVSLASGALTVSGFGLTCCVIEGNTHVFELRNGQLMLTKTLIDIFHIFDDDGIEPHPRKYIEIDYVKKIETTRIESEKDESLNETTVTKIQVEQLKQINEVSPFQ